MEPGEQENSLLGCLMYDHVDNLESFLRVATQETLTAWRDPSTGRSALHFASRASPKCLRHLLKLPLAQVWVNELDANGNSPLSIATCAGNDETAQLLLQEAPLINVNAAFGEEMETALHVAVDNQSISLTQLLMNAGADPSITDSHKESAFVKCDGEALFKLLCRPPHCEAALFAAAEDGRVSFASIALAAGANATCTTPNGRTALMIAAARNHEAVVKLLLKRGKTPVNAQAVVRGEERDALLYAVHNNALASARILLQAGADRLDRALKEAQNRGWSDMEAMLSSNAAVKSGPLSQVQERLKHVLSSDQLAALPKKWHLIGHVLMLQAVDPILSPVLEQVGAAYLECRQIKAETIVVEEITPHGELRVPSVRRVAGREETLTKHTEDGVRYWIDPVRVMFSSGNGTERMHFHSQIKLDDGDICVDMFAGVGYFSIPLALGNASTAGVEIYSLEKNPDSCRFLRMNVAENHVEHVVRVFEGDNRTVGEEAVGRANRVLMGYIPTPVQFISRALEFLDPRIGGVVHYHFVSSVEEVSRFPRVIGMQNLPIMRTLNLIIFTFAQSRALLLI